MIRPLRVVRVLVGFVVSMALVGATTSEASALTGWKDVATGVAYLSPYDSRLDISSVTMVDPQAIRIKISGDAPRAKMYVEGQCRRKDGTWTKRVEAEAIVNLPYSDNLTSWLKPQGKNYCWVWLTAFTRTKANTGVTMRMSIQAKY